MINKHFVVVSLGSIGQRHLENLRSLYPDAIITVVRRTSKSAGKAQRIADHVVGSVSDAFGIQAPTAGFIASPAPFHVDDAEYFVKNNCPVFIEKPLSENLQSARKLLKMSQEQNVHCMVGYILRFLPTMKYLKEIIVQERYGKVLHANISVGQFLPDWRPDQDYRKTVSAQAKLGGGALLELSHEIDYAIHLFGVPDSVAGIVQSTGRLEIDVEDQVDAILGYNSGMVVDLHLDFLQKVKSRNCTITFEDAKINWDLIEGSLNVAALNSEPVKTTVPTVDNELYMCELEHFIKVIENEAECKVGLMDGIEVIRLIDEIKGRPIGDYATRNSQMAENKNVR